MRFANNSGFYSFRSRGLLDALYRVIGMANPLQSMAKDCMPLLQCFNHQESGEAFEWLQRREMAASNETTNGRSADRTLLGGGYFFSDKIILRG
jgi:hypothetical protein